MALNEVASLLGAFALTAFAFLVIRGTYWCCACLTSTMSEEDTRPHTPLRRVPAYPILPLYAAGVPPPYYPASRNSLSSANSATTTTTHISFIARPASSTVYGSTPLSTTPTSSSSTLFYHPTELHTPVNEAPPSYDLDSSSSGSTGRSFTSIDEFYAAFFAPTLFAYQPPATPYRVQAVPRNASPSLTTNPRNASMDITDQGGVTEGGVANLTEREEVDD